MEFNAEKLLMDLFLSVGAKWVLWLLIVLSVLLVVIVVERFIFFMRNRADFTRLSVTVNELMASGDLGRFQKAIEPFTGVEALVLRRSLQSVSRGRSRWKR